MAREFKLEDPGEGIHEAEILELFVSEGSRVSEGDDLLEIETDKAAVEIPSPFDGEILEIAVEAGDDVRVGDVLMKYEPEEKRSEESAEQKEESEAEEDEKKSQEEASSRESSGAEGTEEATGEESSAEWPQERPVPASPATRRLAREEEVDLHEVPPGGEHGEVTSEDVIEFAEEEEPGEERPEAAGIPETKEEKDRILEPDMAELPDFSQWGKVKEEDLRSVRRATARRLWTSWTQIPHVTHHDEVDITELELFRREKKKSVEENGGRLTITILVMKTLAQTLKRFPRFNSSLDVERGKIILKHFYNVGVAVDSDRGLLVPVIRDVDRKSIEELAEEFQSLVETTRSGELTRDQMQGGTVTITNTGPLGGTGFTPVINYPQTAILGMARAKLRQVVEGDLENPEPKTRLILPLLLTFDHRVNDGADAARFMTQLKKGLQDPESLLLRV